MSREPTGRGPGRPIKTPLDRLEEAAAAKAKADATFLRWIPEAYRLGIPVSRICKASGLARPAIYNRLRHAGFVIEPLPPRPVPAQLRPPDPGWEFEPEEPAFGDTQPAALVVNGHALVYVDGQPVEVKPEEPGEPVWVDRPVHR